MCWVRVEEKQKRPGPGGCPILLLEGVTKTGHIERLRGILDTDAHPITSDGCNGSYRHLLHGQGQGQARCCSGSCYYASSQ